MSATPPQILNGLRNALLDLHKVLLDSEKALYERDVAPIESPGQLLTLLLEDPWFEYLRDLSRLVVAIDERVDDKKRPVDAAEAERLVAVARTLLVPVENGEGFERRYWEAMQRDPDVILANGATARAISALQTA